MDADQDAPFSRELNDKSAIRGNGLSRNWEVCDREEGGEVDAEGCNRGRTGAVIGEDDGVDNLGIGIIVADADVSPCTTVSAAPA